ncbi:predicted protein, partial [Nematostella vectensis]
MFPLAPSAPPLNVSGYNTSDSSLQLLWQPVEATHRNGRLVGYKIRYHVTGDLVNFAVSESRLLNTSLTGLLPYTDYVITVCAYTGAGEGPWSAPVIIKTDEEVPSRPPTNLKAQNTSSTSLAVAWQPLSDSFFIHGVLRGYQVSYHRVD